MPRPLYRGGTIGDVRLPYNVYLMDLPGLLCADHRDRIAATLTGYFRPAAIAAGYMECRVTWAWEAPRVAQEELLIYFVRDYRDSVLTPSAPADFAALTHWKAETGSEVYIRDCGGVEQIWPVLANLAFHEALHNKTHLDNGGLHPIGGLAGGALSASTTMTPAVHRLLASSLRTPRLQYTAGCEAYRLAERTYLMGDARS